MSKRVKPIAGCNLPSGERIALRRVDDRVGPTLVSSHLELRRDEIVLATGPNFIKAALYQLGLPSADEKWMLGHLREAVRS